jgi:hypothetical protein
MSRAVGSDPMCTEVGFFEPVIKTVASSELGPLPLLPTLAGPA